MDPEARKEQLKEMFLRLVDPLGYKLSPDEDLVDFLFEQEVQIEKEKGSPFCPCQALTGEREHDMKLVCPCIPFHREHYDAMKRCWCGLYVHKDVVDPDILPQISLKEFEESKKIGSDFVSGEKENVIKNIKTRISVRDYQDRVVSEEDIREIIDAGIHAPTGFDAEPWFFVVVQHKEMMQRMSDHCKPLLLAHLEDATNEKAVDFKNNLATDEFNIFFNAPVLVIVLGSSEGFTTDYDCCLCAENMMLAAHAMGIGSCWIGTACFIQDNLELLDELGIPAGYRVIAPIVFGYAKEDLPMTPRKDPLVVWVK